MSVSLAEVIQAAGYDITEVEDANWLLSKRNEWDELVEQAEEVVDHWNDFVDDHKMQEFYDNKEG